MNYSNGVANCDTYMHTVEPCRCENRGESFTFRLEALAQVGLAELFELCHHSRASRWRYE